MSSKDFMGTREIRLVQAELVGSDKPTKRGGSDGPAEVRLADSTLRSGEPATWGSGQQELNRSWATWAPYYGRLWPSIQREDKPVMATGLERIAAKTRSKPKSRFRSWMATVLCETTSRRAAHRVRWEVFHRIKVRFPLQHPRLVIPYGKLQSLAVL